MFTDPLKNLKAFGIGENHIIADLGAGTGFYSVHLGALASKGKVYAVEIVKDFLTKIQIKAVEAGLNNVEVIWGDVAKKGGTKIGNGVVDAVVASNILFQIEDKDSFVAEIARITKDKGRVLLVDWSTTPVVGAKKVFSKEKARELFTKKGFVWEKDINAGEHHYGMILRK